MKLLEGPSITFINLETINRTLPSPWLKVALFWRAENGKPLWQLTCCCIERPGKRTFLLLLLLHFGTPLQSFTTTIDFNVSQMLLLCNRGTPTKLIVWKDRKYVSNYCSATQDKFSHFFIRLSPRLNELLVYLRTYFLNRQVSFVAPAVKWYLWMVPSQHLFIFKTFSSSKPIPKKHFILHCSLEINHFFLWLHLQHSQVISNSKTSTLSQKSRANYSLRSFIRPKASWVSE